MKQVIDYAVKKPLRSTPLTLSLYGAEIRCDSTGSFQESVVIVEVLLY